MREETESMRETTLPALGEARVTSIKSALFGPDSLKVYGISLAIATLLAVSGAFYRQEGPLWTRLVYWIPLMLVGSALGSLTSAFVIRLETWARSVLLSWAILTLCVGLPMTLLVWLANSVAFQSDLHVEAVIVNAPNVLLISGTMAAIFTFLHQVPAQTHGQASDEGKSPRFMERFPQKLRGAALYAVSAEDHYLRLYTSRGSDIILLRLTDAIIELDGIEGAQVHRSWWVARDAVESVTRGEGKAAFSLKGGTIAPVSRTYAKALREACWY